MKKLVALGLILMAALIMACEAQEDKDIEAARACSDEATKLALGGSNAEAVAKANECDTFMTNKNMSSKEALRIRFGIMLVQQSKMSQIASMVQAMSKGGSTGTNSINGALSYLAFDTTNNALKIKGYGDQLGGGAQMLGGLIYMVTTLTATLGSVNLGDAAAMKDKINTCATSCSAEEKQAIASAAISYQAGACANPTDAASTDPNNNCYKAKQILNGSTDPDTIINNLKNLANT